MHKKPLTELERQGLRLHGLDIGTPSQLSDCFRLGVAWASEQLEQKLAEAEKQLKSIAHIGTENDTLVNRLLGVYQSGDKERNFEKEGAFIPAINKEAAVRIAELEKQNEWVSVSFGKMPPMDEIVEVAVKNKNKPDGIFLYDVASFNQEGWGKRFHTWEDITHWRKPTPPQEKE